MAYFVFTATSDLADGYTLGDSVAVSFGVSRRIPSFKIYKKTTISRSRKRFHRVQGKEYMHTIETVPIVGASKNDLMNMFLRSVADGATFTGDPVNNTGINVAAYQIDGELPDPNRISRDVFTYRFKLVAV